MDKEHILAEIRRTAKGNGNRPLGVQRVTAETGIREADWHGKLWARWGDALREAGFEANTLVEAYESDFLLEKYVELTKELGHFPVKAELQMRARRDRTFPSHNTFRRFGGKSALINKLKLYCESRPGYDDVIQMCRSVPPDSSEDQEPSRRGREVTFGYVYLAKSGRHFKIGQTNAVGRRERELVIQLPEKLSIVHKIVTDDLVGIERYWHRRFERKRANGEWFALSSDDVAAFRRRKTM
jgi:Meiotically up-regulated gene 113